MWNKIIAQDRVKKIIENIVKSGRISHAYLFEGREGVGKDAVALEFAKLLNCENKSAYSACNECKTCLEISALKSSFVKFIFALPSGKAEGDTDENPLEKLSKEDYKNYLEAVRLKAEDLYYRFSLPKANFIRISSIRQIKKDAYFTGKKDKKKVFILSNADMMNQQSANALLKILEEPPKDTILILTTYRVNSLLPTIVGRCQVIKFDKIPREKIKSYLKESDPGISSVDLEIYSELSEGSIRKAAEVANKDYLELREKVISSLRLITGNSFIGFENEISSLLKEKNKEKTKEFLKLMLIYFRDIMYAEAGETEHIINIDKKDKIEQSAGNFSFDVYKIVKLIEESIKDVEGNLFAELVIYNLFLSVQTLISKKAA